MMISYANVNSNLFWRRALKDNVCYRFFHQMFNWKLPHINSLLNVWEIALWQHTIFTEDMDRTVWRITSSRPAVFFKIHLCENKRKRSLVRIPSIFSNVFVSVTRRAVERSWHLHSIYPKFASGTLATTVLTLTKTDDAEWKIDFQDMFASKHNVGGPIN